MKWHANRCKLKFFVRNKLDYENCNYYAFVCKLVELVKINPVAYK